MATEEPNVKIEEEKQSVKVGEEEKPKETKNDNLENPFGKNTRNNDFCRKLIEEFSRIPNEDAKLSLKDLVAEIIEEDLLAIDEAVLEKQEAEEKKKQSGGNQNQTAQQEEKKEEKKLEKPTDPEKMFRYGVNLQDLLQIPSADQVREKLESYESGVKKQLDEITQNALTMQKEATDLNRCIGKARTDLINRNLEQIAQHIAMETTEAFSRLNRSCADTRENARKIFLTSAREQVDTAGDLLRMLWKEETGYWLTFIVIAMRAQRIEQTEICNDAIMRAKIADREKTESFFVLYYHRTGQTEKARQALLRYFTDFTPDEMSETAFIFIRAYLNGLFGTDEAFCKAMQGKLDSYCEALHSSKTAFKDAEKMFRLFIDHIDVSESEELPAETERYCEQKEAIRNAVSDAKRIALFQEYAKAVETLASEEERQDLAAQAMEASFLRMISANSEEEERLLKIRDYYRDIAGANGNIKDVEIEKRKALSGGSSLTRKLMEHAIYNTEDQDMRMRAFALRNAGEALIQTLQNYPIRDEKVFAEERTYVIPSKVTEQDYAFTVNRQTESKYKKHFCKGFTKKSVLNTVFAFRNMLFFILTVLFGICTLGAVFLPQQPVLWVLLGFAVPTGIFLLLSIIGIGIGLKKHYQERREVLEIYRNCVLTDKLLYTDFDKNVEAKKSLLDWLIAM